MEEQGTAISFLSRVQWSRLGTQAMSSGIDAKNRSDRPGRPNKTGLRVSPRLCFSPIFSAHSENWLGLRLGLGLGVRVKVPSP